MLVKAVRLCLVVAASLLAGIILAGQIALNVRFIRLPIVLFIAGIIAVIRGLLNKSDD